MARAAFVSGQLDWEEEEPVSVPDEATSAPTSSSNCEPPASSPSPTLPPPNGQTPTSHTSSAIPTDSFQSIRTHLGDIEADNARLRSKVSVQGRQIEALRRRIGKLQEMLQQDKRMDQM